MARKRKVAATQQPNPNADIMARIAHLKLRAQVGDTSAVNAIVDVLEANPQIGPENGDFGKEQRAAWLQLAAGGDPVRTECLRRQVEQVERDLTEPSAGPAGRMLAARAATCFLVLQVADAETVAAAQRKDAAKMRDASARQAAAERGFQSALKTLVAQQGLTRTPTPSANPPRAVEEQSTAGAGTV